jgi:hypothetical protein
MIRSIDQLASDPGRPPGQLRIREWPGRTSSADRSPSTTATTGRDRSSSSLASAHARRVHHIVPPMEPSRSAQYVRSCVRASTRSLPRVRAARAMIELMADEQHHHTRQIAHTNYKSTTNRHTDTVTDRPMQIKHVLCSVLRGGLALGLR